jgi:hypothetical protein
MRGYDLALPAGGEDPTGSIEDRMALVMVEATERRV